MNEAIQRVGDGKTELTIGPESGRVVVGFPKPLTWFALDPENAAHVGKALINAAVKCGAKVSISLPQRQLNPLVRTMLVTRVERIQRDMAAKGRKPQFIAEEIVDQVLREIL